ncbi:hypothetical protein H4R18_003672 [Coemansia javaensis]|uniref:RING-type domain-containing protein n=1 Tax=Coemansia javaensis TaxID=2761396 RepID=A0A9W8H6D5_9FUNG|nr:hypothetical protein H4R18_003672 [Coemansia javaensis]
MSLDTADPIDAHAGDAPADHEAAQGAGAAPSAGPGAGDAHMADAGDDAEDHQDPVAVAHERVQVRLRAGNELMSRIISQSVITSVAQELERRNAIAARVRTETPPAGDGSGLGAAGTPEPQGQPGRPADAAHTGRYAMSPESRYELYLRVAQFIQSLLEGGTAPQAPQADSADSADSANSAADGGANNAGSASSTAGGGAEQGAAGGPAAEARRDMLRNTSYRLFLLPGAIEQALAEYERVHREPPDRAAGGPGAGGAGGPPGSGGGGGGGGGGSGHIPPREPNEAEREQAERLREREEKLEQLRNIARAISDERRSVEFPLLMLGIRLNSDIFQRARAIAEGMEGRAIGSGSMGSGSRPASATSATSSMAAEPSAPATQAVPEAEEDGEPPARTPASEGPLRGGLFGRLGAILPGLAGYAASLQRGRDGAPQREPAQADDGSAGSSSSGGASNETTAAAASGSSTPESEQPGISVYITVNNVSLMNPIVLPLVTHSLFPELIDEVARPGVVNMQSGAAANSNYDLFLEIANIVGRVTLTTISQDAVDKHLGEYRFEGVVGGAAVARAVSGDGQQAGEAVRLVSADQCPVCLEAFEAGEAMRVLGCRHAMHKACGDSWLTGGANRCPICRSKAVQVAAAAGGSE